MGIKWNCFISCSVELTNEGSAKEDVMYKTIYPKVKCRVRVTIKF